MRRAPLNRLRLSCFPVSAMNVGPMQTAQAKTQRQRGKGALEGSSATCSISPSSAARRLKMSGRSNALS